MVARIRTVAFEGVDVRPVDAQVQVSGGMPAFTLVGPITIKGSDAAAKRINGDSAHYGGHTHP